MNTRILLSLLVWVSAVAGAQAAPKWRFIESWRKGGAVEGAYAFDGMLNSPATALASAPGGRLVVLDALDSRLHLLDSTGAVVRSFGRDGAGPGEFRHASGMAVSHDGRILVNDPFNGRYVLYAANGDFVRVIPIVRKYLFAFDMMWDASFDGTGRLLQSVAIPPKKPQPVAGLPAASPFADSTLVTERWNPDLSRSDSVSLCGAPPSIVRNEAQYFVREVGRAIRVGDARPPSGPPPRARTWVPVPFTQQRPSYVRDRAGFEWAPSAIGSAELQRRESGRCNAVAARITLRGPRASIPDSLRDKELTHVPADIRARAPRVYPWFHALRVDDKNRLWVERSVASGMRFEVFTSSGEPVCEIDGPAGLDADLPIAFANDHLYGFVKTSDDVPYLVAWRIVRPGGR